MDQFISSYTALTTQTVTGIQHLGILSIPLVLGILALAGLFGGERAIRATGIAFGVVAVLSIVLMNVQGFATWLSSLPHS